MSGVVMAAERHDMHLFVLQQRKSREQILLAGALITQISCKSSGMVVRNRHGLAHSEMLGR